MEAEGEAKQVEAPRRLGQLLTLRNLRDIAIVAGIAVAAWKLGNAPFNINIGEFSFTDLLALILALFSVWLSAMFYFKADEASSRFYDNSYKFTREMSVMLGKIEAGFGERLKSIDEHSNKVREYMAGIVDDKSAKVQEIVDDLVKKPPEGGNVQLLEDLRRANAELEDAQRELSSFRGSASDGGLIRSMAASAMKEVVRGVFSDVDRSRLESAAAIPLSEVFKDRAHLIPASTKQILVMGGFLAPDQTTLSRLGLMAFSFELRHKRD
jgi:hypothetical protein